MTHRYDAKKEKFVPVDDSYANSYIKATMIGFALTAAVLLIVLALCGSAL